MFFYKFRQLDDLKNNNFVPTNIRPNPRKRKALKKLHETKNN